MGRNQLTARRRGGKKDEWFGTKCAQRFVKTDGTGRGHMSRTKRLT